MKILLFLALPFVTALIGSIWVSKSFLQTYKPNQLIFLNYFMLGCSSILLALLGEKYNVFEDYLDVAYIFLICFACYSIAKKIWSPAHGKLK